MESCIELYKDLAQKYSILKENFIGHSDIAPKRKKDPGIFFNWKLLSKQGFGIWHEVEPLSINISLYEFGIVGKNINNVQGKFRKLGYNIEVTKIFDEQTNFVIRAFQSKFCPQIIKDLDL